MKRGTLVALSYLSILAACGGGGSDISAPTAVACAARVVRVDVNGDSINHAHAPFLQAELDQRFGAGAVIVRDRAVPGTTSQQLVDGTDGLNLPWPQSVAADFVIVNHGVNDSYAPLGVSLAQYRINLETIGRAPARVVFQTPSPTTSPDYITGPRAAVMREVAGGAIADVAAYMLGLGNWQGHLADGIHPDATLHAMIAHDVTGPALAAMIAPLRCLP